MASFSLGAAPDARIARSNARRVLIVGGSTRAAAWSALRAGLQPVCADLFADQDTRQIAEVIPVRDYPDSLPDDVARVQADGWFYTGALENRPDLIERMDRPDVPYGPLWGTPAPALRLIRDPFWLHDQLQSGGFPVLEVRRSSSPPPANGLWMHKPLASAGGRAVGVWDDRVAGRCCREPMYFQSRRDGPILAALYRRSGDTVQLLGMTEQGIEPAISQPPEPYSYLGSLGPIPMPGSMDEYDAPGRRLTAQVERLARCGLQGLFGVDFVLDEFATPWILEVNPRYTASIEIVELARRQALLATAATPDAHTADPPPSRPVVAKVVLYAPSALTAPELSPCSDEPDPWRVPAVADVPVPATRIKPTWPICTVMAAAANREECLDQLRRRVDTAWQLINDRAATQGAAPSPDSSVLDRLGTPR